MQDNCFPEAWSLSKWLAVKTREARDLVVNCIESHQPVISETNCQRLLLAHMHYRRLVNPIYDDPNLKRLLFPFFDIHQPQLFEHQSPRQIVPELQLSGLGRSLPLGLLPRLGWLYSTQFVDFGLSQLLVDPKASHHCFHIDANQRKDEWHALRKELDGLDLSESDEESLAKAAVFALSTYSGIFNSAYKI